MAQPPTGLSQSIVFPVADQERQSGIGGMIIGRFYLHLQDLQTVTEFEARGKFGASVNVVYTVVNVGVLTGKRNTCSGGWGGGERDVSDCAASTLPSLNCPS